MSTPRLYVTDALINGAEIILESDQAHYLVHVMRLKPGDPVHLFNGQDGEWHATIARSSKRETVVTVAQNLRDQEGLPDIHFCFAPLKKARLDFLVQKATELGASAIQPVITQHTVAQRVNMERLRANVIEAAEQCGALVVPDVLDPQPFSTFLADFEAQRALIFCDEAADVKNPIEALHAIKGQSAAVLIGPEGGFSKDERSTLHAMQNTVILSLGPRILRADTAGIAALSLVQSAIGDW